MMVSPAGTTFLVTRCLDPAIDAAASWLVDLLMGRRPVLFDSRNKNARFLAGIFAASSGFACDIW